MEACVILAVCVAVPAVPRTVGKKDASWKNFLPIGGYGNLKQLGIQVLA